MDPARLEQAHQRDRQHEQEQAGRDRLLGDGEQVIIRQNHDREDRAGAGDRGDRQRKHRDVVLRLGLAVVIALARPTRAEDHLEPEQEENNAAGDLERLQTNAQQRQEHLAEHNEADQDRRRESDTTQGDFALLAWLEPRRQAHEQRQRTDRIDRRQQDQEAPELLLEHQPAAPMCLMLELSNILISFPDFAWEQD